MILWAAIWGGFLGALWPGGGGFRLLLGVALGALAGLMLRGIVRSEVQVAVAAALRTRASEPAPVEVPTAPVEPAPAHAAPRRSSTPSQPHPQPHSQPAWPTVAASRLREWLLGGNTIVRVGLLVLFVGLAFLARYAIENALLPPGLRLAAFAAVGATLFIVGWRLRRRGPQQLGYALSLQGGGIAVLYLAVYAAFRLYQLLPAGPAFALLAVVCAFAAAAAMAQNAQALAWIGFAGGFAAPLLVSTGTGEHTTLFGYYLVLGLAIAVIAWTRAWRGLNLLGFFATFGVATAWGVLAYTPSQFASTEPFLVGFFLVYLAATVMVALRHGLPPGRAIDGTLVFGLPLAAFSLQVLLVRGIEHGASVSAAVLAILYLGLALALRRPHADRPESARWLSDAFAAIVLGFASIALLLALDARWTGAAWAVEGAGVYWLGRRQGRWGVRAAGLALQPLAALAFLSAGLEAGTRAWPLAHAPFVGALMLAASALAIAMVARDRASLLAPASAELRSDGLGERFVRLEGAASPWLFWAGFLWLQLGFRYELARDSLHVGGWSGPAYAEGLRLHLQLLAWTGSAVVFAMAGRRWNWPAAITPVWTVVPVLLLGALAGVVRFDPVLAHGGWLVWPTLLALHLVLLHRLDREPPEEGWRWAHAGGVWIVLLLAADTLLFAMREGGLRQPSWTGPALLALGTLALAALTRCGLRAGRQWPLDRFATAYGWLAAAPLAALLALGTLFVSVLANGHAPPLPFAPLLNVVDISVALAIVALAQWFIGLRHAALRVPADAQAGAWLAVPGALGLVALSMAWARAVHHHTSLRWRAGELVDSFVVQGGWSILWTVAALGLMVLAFHRGWRRPWLLGAALLAATLLKLFVVDLANRGGAERIVVFIAVGVLMLVLGYFAPIPPQDGDRGAAIPRTG